MSYHSCLPFVLFGEFYFVQFGPLRGVAVYQLVDGHKNNFI